MEVRYDGRSGTNEVYTARSGHLSATGGSAWAAEHELRKAERRYRREGDWFTHLLGYGCDLAGQALMVCANAVIRPLPTLALGTFFWVAHWVAMAMVPAGFWWAWGAHAFFGLAALGAMATKAGEIEREEGIAINGIAEVSQGAFQAVYWGTMVASIVASGFMAGQAFDWLAARGWLQADAFPHMRDVVQCAAGAATFGWRGDFHPTLARATLPWGR